MRPSLRLESEQNYRAIRYILFRQSPKLLLQFLGADGRTREEILMGIEARDDFMEQGYNLGFGLWESHNVYLLGLLNYIPVTHEFSFFIARPSCPMAALS